ncbi:hypothetical protein BASA83_012333 [Batrachochytrium salamandrivorans]|nr:hypothetical protein BASA83_012333 [Batrachochytrium salamandrivorans]
MQFFHLFSFVVAASYAAALPQPEGLSEKYSDSVDTNLASGLEARSYQPGLNFQKNSATLTLLKRRDNSGSRQSFPPDTTPDTTPNETVSDPFSKDEVISMDLAFTIDKGSGLGDDEYSKVEPDLAEKLKGWNNAFQVGLNAIHEATANIAHDVDFVADNLQKIDKSIELIMYKQWLLLWKLKKSTEYV